MCIYNIKAIYCEYIPLYKLEFRLKSVAYTQIESTDFAN